MIPLRTLRPLISRSSLSFKPTSTTSSSLLRPTSFKLFSTTKLSSATVSSVSDKNKAPSPVDQFANGNNAYYAEEMYKLWKVVSWSLYIQERRVKSSTVSELIKGRT